MKSVVSALKRVFSTYDSEGREIPDPTLMEVPAYLRRPESVEERMRRIIRETMSRAAEEKGFESIEDSWDFEVDDDDEPLTDYELMGVETPLRQPQAAPKEELKEQPKVKKKAPPKPSAEAEHEDSEEVDD